MLLNIDLIESLYFFVEIYNKKILIYFHNLYRHKKESKKKTLCGETTIHNINVLQ